MNNTFLWYDLETFGLNPRYDRISQAAWIRTDLDFNVIDEGRYFYCRLSGDYLPSPSSCVLTGITPDIVNKEGLSEAEFASVLHKEMMEKGTISVGFNSANFDDEAIRALFYRNLIDPYEREWGYGRGRWDIIPLVRACRDLRSEGLVFTKLNEETGAPSFRLTDLTEENNISQVGAHDALVDVRATIEVAKLIKEKQRDLFFYALSHRSKTDISKLIDLDNKIPFLCTSPAFVSERGNTHPLVPLFYDPERPTTLYCFDLLKDLPETFGPYQESGIYRLQINKMPFVAPLSVLNSENEEKLGFTKDEVIKRARSILSEKVLSEDVILREKESPAITYDDPDLTMYSSFLSDSDKITLRKIRTLPMEEKKKVKENSFEDKKLYTLLKRQICRSFPESLSNEEKEEWRKFCRERLTNPILEGAYSYDAYSFEIGEMLKDESLEEKTRTILLSLKEYGESLYNLYIR